MTATREGSRSKRASVLTIATEEFGTTGYEATKWSTVAERVGIGQPALYHYFESKAHCLLTIMQTQLEHSYEHLEAVRRSTPDPAVAVETALRDVYRVSSSDLMRLRVLHANLAILSAPRSSQREEAARIRCRALVHDFEQAWAELLADGMRTGAFVEREPLALARAVLGLVVSVWSWYRPGGPTAITDVGDFTVDCALRLIA